MSDDILHTGRADIHHPKGPLTGGQAARSECAEGCAWASHMRGGEPLYVQICMLCERINWEDLAEQVARVRAAVAEEIAAQLELLQIAQEDLMQRRSAEGYPEQARQCATRARAYKAAAGVAREHAAAPSVRPDPLALCCDRLGCGHHINGHSHGSHCTHPGCGCRVWRDHVNCVHRLDTDRTPDVGTPDHPEALCRRCGGPNVVWVAPSPLWNAVMRGGSINGDDDPAGIVCPTCFAVLAQERGVAELWRLSAERVKVELETVTPSGRVWDEQAWRWREAP